ncbi:hypothetical protein D3C78_1489720 [compost metagenome]
MHQHQVNLLGFQALEAALDGKARVCGAEVETRLAFFELLTDLADDHPVIALAAQQWAEALFAAAVGGGGVDQVDAQVTGLGQQLAGLVVVGDGKAVGVFDSLITPQLDCTQAQWRDAQTGAAQGAVQIVESRQAHGSSCSQTGRAIGGRGSSGRVV